MNYDQLTDELPVGKDNCGLNLYCSLKIDGEEKRRFKSESFLGQFAYMLMALMNDGYNRKFGMRGYTNVSFGDADDYELRYNSHYNITGQSNEEPFVVSKASTGGNAHFVDYDQPYPSYIIITGASDMNGVYHGKQVGSRTYELYDKDTGEPIDGSPDLDDEGNPIAGTGAGTVTDGYMVDMKGFHSQRMSRGLENLGGGYHQMLYAWQLMVGKSDNPVSVDDVYLHDRIMHGGGDGTLNHGNRTISPLVTDKPTSRFTISQPFTNEGDTPISIQEIGIETAPDQNIGTNNGGFSRSDGIGLHLVRDTLDNALQVPSGSTLSVDYELVIRLTPDTQDTVTDGSNGGFLEPFMAELRQMAIGNSRGNRLQVTGARPELGTRRGIILGDSNQFASMTDKTLNIPDNDRNGFRHGIEDGQLFYHEQFVEEVVMDKDTQTATFTLSRIVENQSSVPQTIREKGLWDSNGMIARMALAPEHEFIIEPGEYKKVKFTIQVVV